jgi:hypothetical protein
LTGKSAAPAALTARRLAAEPRTRFLIVVITDSPLDLTFAVFGLNAERSGSAKAGAPHDAGVLGATSCASVFGAQRITSRGAFSFAFAICGSTK